MRRPASIGADGAALERLVASPARSASNVARDRHRHPLETLRFFDIAPTATVVEILPGSRGYYLEILAPYLRERGRYVAASRAPDAPPRYLADHARLLARLRASATGLVGSRSRSFLLASIRLHRPAAPISC
ncbi:MAG: hypothetical protein R3E48_20905 [Burkholderiaceae bacterium]